MESAVLSALQVRPAWVTVGEPLGVATFLASVVDVGVVEALGLPEEPQAPNPPNVDCPAHLHAALRTVTPTAARSRRGASIFSGATGPARVWQCLVGTKQWLPA